MNRLVAVALAVLAAAACSKRHAARKPDAGVVARVAPIDAGTCVGGVIARDIELKSADGMTIHATLSNPCGGAARPVVVLAHQMCRDRSEWSKPVHDWVAMLGARGVATLAVDLRGHGKSLRFSDGTTHDLCEEIDDAAVAGRYAAMADDVKAAVAYARAEARAAKVALVGASIGANAALVAFADDADLAMVVALSPGADYRGIVPAASIDKAAGRRMTLIAAEDDPASAAAVRGFQGKAPKLDVRVYRDGGHGNDMFVTDPAPLGYLVIELAEALR
jgi:dienelactone hydrolase